MESKYRRKKAQASMEFMTLFLFLMVVISGVMYITGKYTVDLNDERREKTTEDFARSLTNEFDYIKKVEGGYKREVLIPDFLMRRYNVTLYDEGYLRVQNPVYKNNSRYDHYYSIPSNVSSEIIVRGNNTYLVLEKSHREDFKGIQI